MKNKYYKTLIAVMFIIICATIFVAFRYVKITASTFKFTNSNKKVVLTMNLNSSYNELKLDLKQKYVKKLSDVIEQTRIEFNNSLNNVLGASYVEKRNALTQLENEIKKDRNEFLNSNDYLNGKQVLKELKDKIDETFDEDKKEELQSEFNVKLNELSTLNIKFNNVLKAKREKYDEIKGELKALFNSKKDELKKQKEIIEQKTRLEIANIISQFNFELKELNDAFSVSINEREMPFDNNFVNDLNAVAKFENECLNDSEVQNSNVKVEVVALDGLEDVVVLENTSKLKS